MAAFPIQRGVKTPSMCDSATHSPVEANVDRGGAASPCRPERHERPGPRRRIGLLAPPLLLAAMLLTGGCTDTCLLNGECPGETLCLDGVCRTPCTLDVECPLDEFCLAGGCRPLEPGERPPCRDDAGCLEADMSALPDLGFEAPDDMAPATDPDAASPDLGDVSPDEGAPADGGEDGGPDTGFDAGLDAGLDASPDGAFDGGPTDGSMPDGSMPDASLTDASLADAAVDVEPRDPGSFDGGLGVDLTGLYAVTTTVVVATGGALVTDDELRHIHRLDWQGGTRYTLEVYATDGAFEHRADVDLASPDGPGRYQFEYPLGISAPEGCVGTELRFQRGMFEVFEPGYRLLAGEERVVRFEGEACAAGGYLVRVDLVWTPLPPP